MENSSSKRLMLAKFFNRCEAKDFYDDGTSFRAYVGKKHREIVVTVAKNNGETFLSASRPSYTCYARVTYDRAYREAYDKFNQACDRYNGVRTLPTDDELAVWEDDLNYLYEKWMEIENAPFITNAYFNPLDGKWYAFAIEDTSYSFMKNKTYKEVLKPISDCNFSYINGEFVPSDKYFELKYLKVCDTKEGD